MRQRKQAKERNGMKKAQKLIEEGTLIHVLLPWSIRYHFKFTSDGRQLQYIAEIPDDTKDADKDFDTCVHNAIVFATHYVRL